MSDPTDFAKLLALHAAAVADATEKHAMCLVQTATARSAETNALNRLNEAQRQFDKIVAQMRKDAPRDSDWKRDERDRYTEVEK